MKIAKFYSHQDTLQWIVDNNAGVERFPSSIIDRSPFWKVTVGNAVAFSYPEPYNNVPAIVCALQDAVNKCREELIREAEKLIKKAGPLKVEEE